MSTIIKLTGIAILTFIHAAHSQEDTLTDVCKLTIKGKWNEKTPFTGSPTVFVSLSPTVSKSPSSSPSKVPSVSPTVSKSPSSSPSKAPSGSPTTKVMPTNAPSKAPTMAPTNYGQGVNGAIGNYVTDTAGLKVPTECGIGASVTATPDSIEPSPTSTTEAKTMNFTSCSSLTVKLQDKSNSDACLAKLKTMDIDAALGLNPLWELAYPYGFVQFLSATLDCSSANSQQIGIFALFGSMTVLFSLL